MICMEKQAAKIQAKYPQWWASDEAKNEFAKMWGITLANPIVNEHGVFFDAEEIYIEIFKNYYGKVSIQKVSENAFAISTSYGHSTGGGGSMPAVNDTRKYESHAEAFDAGIDELIRRFESMKQYSDVKPGEIDRVISIIEKQKQLDLFQMGELYGT